MTYVFFLECLSITKLEMTENDKSEVPKHEEAKADINFLPQNQHLPRESIKG